MSCQQEAPSINSNDRWQITGEIVVDAQLSEQGLYTALLLSSNTLEIWNNQERQKQAIWQGQQLVPETYLLHLSKTAEHILTANKKVIQIWDSSAKESLGTLDFTENLGDAQITQISFWEPPYKVFIGTSSGDIIFADTKNNSYRVNRSHSGEVTKLVLSDNKEILFSGGNDGYVYKWDLFNYRPLASKDLPFRITSLAIGQNNQVFISDALKDHIVWDSVNDSIVGELTYWKQYKWFRQAVFDPEYRWLITSSPKTDMYLWELQNMSMQGSWLVEAQSMGSTVEDMTLLPENRLLTISSDAVLEYWDLKPLMQNN